jgi:exonuclease III
MAHDISCIVLNWNAQGLNNPARQQVVRDLVIDNACTIVCLQETKLQCVDDEVISSTLGQKFLTQYASLPAVGTCRGIIVACSQDDFILS